MQLACIKCVLVAFASGDKMMSVLLRLGVVVRLTVVLIAATSGSSWNSPPRSGGSSNIGGTKKALLVARLALSILYKEKNASIAAAGGICLPIYFIIMIR